MDLMAPSFTAAPTSIAVIDFTADMVDQRSCAWQAKPVALQHDVAAMDHERADDGVAVHEGADVIRLAAGRVTWIDLGPVR